MYKIKTTDKHCTSCVKLLHRTGQNILTWYSVCTSEVHI